MKLYAVWTLAAIMALADGADANRFGRGGAFRLEYSTDSFGVRSHGVIEGNGTKVYPLPQSSLEEYIRLRPADIKMNPIAATAGRYERQEVIGPHQVVGNRLWFGNNFYDGEGDRGVGAFGYFDTETRRYTMFSPPEVAPFEISAILVEPNTVWLGLDVFTEDISTIPGGLAQWDMATHAIRKYPLEFAVARITREGNSLRLTTRGGYAMLTGGKVQRFQTDKMGTIPIARFPPPPSHY